MDNNQPVGMFYILFSVTLHLKHPHTLQQLSREFVCVIVSVPVSVFVFVSVFVAHSLTASKRICGCETKAKLTAH